MVFTVMAARTRAEPEIKQRRITGAVAERRAAGTDGGGRRQSFTGPTPQRGAAH